MNLAKKKILAAKTLGVGKDRVVFMQSRLRKKKQDKKKKKGLGKVRKKVNTRKKDYVTMTRKLRKYVAELNNQGRLSKEDVIEIRKRIRNKKFRSKAHLKEYIG